MAYFYVFRSEQFLGYISFHMSSQLSCNKIHWDTYAILHFQFVMKDVLERVFEYIRVKELGEELEKTNF